MLSDTVIKSLLYFRRYNTTKLSQRHGSVSTLDLCANIYQRQSYKQDIVDIMTLIAEKNEDEVGLVAFPHGCLLANVGCNFRSTS